MTDFRTGERVEVKTPSGYRLATVVYIGAHDTVWVSPDRSDEEWDVYIGHLRKPVK